MVDCWSIFDRFVDRFFKILDRFLIDVCTTLWYVSLLLWLSGEATHQSINHSINQPIRGIPICAFRFIHIYTRRCNKMHTTRPISHSVTRSLNHWINQPLSHWVTESLNPSVTQSLTHSVTQSLSHSANKPEWDRETNGWKLHGEIHETNDQSPYIPI